MIGFSHLSLHVCRVRTSRLLQLLLVRLQYPTEYLRFDETVRGIGRASVQVRPQVITAGEIVGDARPVDTHDVESVDTTSNVPEPQSSRTMARAKSFGKTYDATRLATKIIAGAQILIKRDLYDLSLAPTFCRVHIRSFRSSGTPSSGPFVVAIAT
jgi:hypothetical protein